MIATGEWIQVFEIGSAQTYIRSSAGTAQFLRRRDYRYSGLAELEHDFERWNAVAPTPLEIQPSLDGRISLLSPRVDGAEFGARARYLTQQATEVGPFLKAARAVVRAVIDLHVRDLIHQNIKPSNIFLTETDALLIDPGSAALVDEALRNLRCPYVLNRVLPYLAPEQTGRMARSVDARTDLYALGVVFFEVLAGSPPFVSSDPLEIIHAHLARRPPPLQGLCPDLPAVLVAIVDRLLQKDPERRYQSARGLLYDLDTCGGRWERHASLVSFALGRADVPQTVVFDGTLFGRDKEREQLKTALANASNGRPNLLLISGPPGIGKSALARFVTRLAFVENCHVGVGKCDQLSREQPYSVLRQALTEIVGQLLFQQDHVLVAWRNRFRETMGGLGGAVLDICPSLERIVGKQAQLSPLEAVEAKARIQLAMQRLVSVVATCGHSLVLFLDDLQWADGGTLELLQHMLATAGSLPLLAICSYRSTEVFGAHPVLLTIRSIEEHGILVRSCPLDPLPASSITELLAASLGRPVEDVRALADTVLEKTLGNPFFIGVFLQALVARGLLRFDGGWHWDLEEIRDRHATDNVVELLRERMEQLTPDARRILEYAALFGASTRLSDLMLVLGSDRPSLLRHLHPAVLASLVRLREGRVVFLHDRVQETALSMASPELLPIRHLEIADVLQRQLNATERENRIFEHVSHRNAGRLALSPSERLNLARLNLSALEKAKRAAAFATAFDLAEAGIECLNPGDWVSDYDLCFALHREQAELTFYCGHYARAEALSIALERRALNHVDRASARGLLVKQFIVQARFDEAIESAQQALALLGADLPTEASRVHVRFQEERTRNDHLLRGREPGQLASLAPMRDAAARLQLELLVRVNPAIFFRRPDMLGLNILLMTNLSLEHGHTPVSAFAYAEFGFLCALETEDYCRAYAFTQLGLQLADESRDPVQICRVTHLAAWIQHYTQPLSEADKLYRKGFEAGSESGEREWAAYHAYSRATRILLVGVELESARREIEHLRDYVQCANSGAIVQLLDAVRGQIDYLTQAANRDELMDGIESRLQLWHSSENPQAIFIHRAYRSFSLVLERRYDEALEHAEQALGLAQQAPNHPYVELAHFVRGIAAAARLRIGVELPPEATAEAARLESLASNCPDNYGVRYSLLRAELGRLRGDGWANGRHYEEACLQACRLKHVHEEGLAHQMAARFWLELGHTDFYETHVRRARTCWLRWGARHLTALIEQEGAQSSDSMVGRALHDGFDIRSLIKSSQAISSELDRSKLLSRVMHVILENAGAERGALICPAVEGLELVVSATADGTQDLTTSPVDESTWVLAEIVRYAYRTGERVVIADASADARFLSSSQVNRRAVRSVLCLPVGAPASLHGVLYLENPLVAGAFTAERLAVVEVLANQASISLENAALFARSQRAECTLRAKEEDLRITLDSIGDAVIATDAKGCLRLMNPVACKLTGLTIEEASAQPLCRILQTLDGRTREPVVDLIGEVVHTAQDVQRTEDTIVISRDGTERRVAESGAPIRDSRGDIVGVVLVFRDVTERYELEERFRQTQKMDSLGRLAGGIAHDFNNMLAGILGSAEFLATKIDRTITPDIYWCVKTITESALRAGELTKQLLAFSRKGKKVSTLIEVHQVISEALGLLERSIDRRIRIERQFSCETLHVIGDPGLLQSVLLNLGINARDAMPDGGKLRVTTRPIRLESAECETVSDYHLEPGDYVEIEIADDGCGIPQGVLDRIFEPFFTTKPPGKGTGLGLATVHGTLVAHGGAVRVETSVGEGTTFRLWIPRQQTTDQRVPEISSTRVKTELLRVLVVDDEPVARVTASHLLESLGHRPMVATDGREGVIYFEREHSTVDLVLLDYIMPTLNGAEVFRQMRAIEPDIPVVLVSGFAHETAVEELTREGLAGFLMKPYTRASLMAALEVAMDRKRDGTAIPAVCQDRIGERHP